MTINEKLNNIQEGVLLANHTTFRIGGPAGVFIEPKDAGEVKWLLASAKEYRIRV